MATKTNIYVPSDLQIDNRYSFVTQTVLQLITFPMFTLLR